MAQLTSFIISMLITSLIVVTLMVGMQETSQVYNTTYDNQSIASFDKFDKLNNLTKEIEESSMTLTNPSGITDIVGSLVTGGFRVFLLMGRSLDIFRELVDSAFTMIGLGALTAVFKSTIIAIVMLVVVVGLIIGSITGRGGNPL